MVDCKKVPMVGVPTTITCPSCHEGDLLYQKPTWSQFCYGIGEHKRYSEKEYHRARWWCSRCGHPQSYQTLRDLKLANKLVQMPTAMRKLMPVLAMLAALPTLETFKNGQGERP